MDRSGVEQADVKRLSPLNLAYVGDAVYELLAREQLVAGGSRPMSKLHTESVDIVCAAAQARAYDRLEEIATEEELDILRRGKNAHPGRVPKNSTILEYRKATAVETLFGYLYLLEKNERIRILFDSITQIL